MASKSVYICTDRQIYIYIYIHTWVIEMGVEILVFHSILFCSDVLSSGLIHFTSENEATCQDHVPHRKAPNFHASKPHSSTVELTASSWRSRVTLGLVSIPLSSWERDCQ